MIRQMMPGLRVSNAFSLRAHLLKFPKQAERNQSDGSKEATINVKSFVREQQTNKTESSHVLSLVLLLVPPTCIVKKKRPVFLTTNSYTALFPAALL